MFKHLRHILPLWNRIRHLASDYQPHSNNPHSIEPHGNEHEIAQSPCNEPRHTGPSSNEALSANSQLETPAAADSNDKFAQAHPSSGDVASLINQMLEQGRHALLLRPQIASNLSPELYEKAKYALEKTMGLVPTGNVYLESSMFDADYQVVENSATPREFTVVVHSVFLDRYVVTNHQFQQFVNAGGYHEMAIWDQEVWPAVLDFIDQTDQPGPRFWKNGRYLRGESNLPVVGVSWYEAVAYSRWVGKRLPTDAEWVKAGSWPVTLSPGSHLQRKYPWGDTFDHGKANVWGSGPGHIVPVDQFSEGVSVGGLYQLIGNVWEWTSTTLETDPEAEEAIHGPVTLLKTIRGGAFDTYFEHQANCHFASGENPILRKHNIGFRCALSMCDIAGPPDVAPPDAVRTTETSPNNLVELFDDTVHAETFDDPIHTEALDDPAHTQPFDDQNVEETLA